MLSGGERWDKQRYNDKYILILIDQEVQGTIKTFTDTIITLEFWESTRSSEKYYITANDGTKLQFSREGRQLFSAEPEISMSGTEIEISSLIAAKLQGEKKGNMGLIFHGILLEMKSLTNKALFRKIFFSVMAHIDILPLIFFALLIGIALSLSAEKAVPTIKPEFGSKRCHHEDRILGNDHFYFWQVRVDLLQDWNGWWL